MGLIKAAMGAAGGVLADQWKEFFYCDSMPPDILMMKGQKQTSSRGRSSNTSGEVVSRFFRKFISSASKYRNQIYGFSSSFGCSISILNRCSMSI